MDGCKLPAIAVKNPHPNPLPEYRVREQATPNRENAVAPNDAPNRVILLDTRRRRGYDR